MLQHTLLMNVQTRYDDCSNSSERGSEMIVFRREGRLKEGSDMAYMARCLWWFNLTEDGI